MPMTRPISDLIVHAGEIADYCRKTSEPVLITHSGGEDVILISAASYRRQQALLDAYVPSFRENPGKPLKSGQEKLLAAARLLRECLPETG